MRPPITSNLGNLGPHTEWDCIPEASAGTGGTSGVVGADEAGLSCSSGFKSNRDLSCLSTCSGGVPIARRSNQVCFQVILPVLSHWWGGFGLQSFLSFLNLSHNLYPFPTFISFLKINNELSNIINILPCDWAQHGYQRPIPGAGGRTGESWLPFLQ